MVQWQDKGVREVRAMHPVSSSRAKVAGFRRLLMGGLLLLAAMPLMASAKDTIRFQIDGVDPSLQQRLLAALPNTPYDGKESRLQELILSFHLRLQDALQAYGYYDATFHAQSRQGKNGDALVIYAVNLGKPIRIRKTDIKITGKVEDYPQQLRRIPPFPLKKENVLNQVAYETWKEEALSSLQSIGYIRAQYDRHEILIDRQEYWAEIYLWLNSGERFRIGKVAIVGAQRYPRWFIERYLTFKSGDWYYPRALSVSQSNLHDANRFEDIVVSADTEHAANGEVPVTVQLKSLPEQHLKVGAGYATDIGINGTLDYDNYNMFQRAQHLHVAAQVAQKTRNIGAGYTWPVGAALGSEYLANASFQNQSYQIWSANELRAAVGRKWALENNAKKNLNSTLAAMINLEQASYTVSGISDSSFYIFPSLSYSIQNYRNILRPVSGFAVHASVEGASKVWGSTSNFARLRVRGNWDTMLGSHWGVGARATLGALWLHGPIAALPPDLRFFAGGQNSLPGYAFQSQGPTDAAGAVVGGRMLAVGGIHLDRFLSKDWAVGAFYDVGNAFDNFAHFHALQDVGIGARWYSPVGPIVLDLAHPLIAPRAPAIRVVLSVGFTL